MTRSQACLQLYRLPFFRLYENLFFSPLEKIFERRIFIFEDNKKAAISAPHLPPILLRKRCGVFAYSALLLLAFSCDVSC